VAKTFYYAIELNEYLPTLKFSIYIIVYVQWNMDDGRIAIAIIGWEFWFWIHLMEKGEQS